jgi:hypothetical protein
MYNTLLLDDTNWDLAVDNFGNIAITEPSYALAQDVASAIRLFLGELWYDTTQGIPYFQKILGHLPPQALYVGYNVQAALSVPGVVEAKCTVITFTEREIQGQVTFVDQNGVEQNVIL